MSAITQTDHASFAVGATGMVRRSGAAHRRSEAAGAACGAIPRRAGGAVPPTRKSVAAGDVDVTQVDGEPIRHLAKIGKAGWSLRHLGRACGGSRDGHRFVER
ncbi:MAG: hypothetical protein ACLFTL_01045 [Alphaproteobacteria bacterium]